MRNDTLELLKKSSPLLVASLDGDDLPYLLEEARSDRADIVEIRMDLWGNFFREEMLEKMARFKDRVGIPMLVSFRGGRPFPSWWLPVHWRALSHASLIDVEWNPKYPWREIAANARRINVGLIISHHDYQTTPSVKNLIKIARAAYGKKADLVKIATRVNTEADVRALLQVNTTFAPKKLMTVMGMGPMGTLSRIVGPLFQSSLIYGYIGTPTASGQLPYRELQERVRSLYPRYDQELQGPAGQAGHSPALIVKPVPPHTRRFQAHLSKLKVDAYWISHVPDLFYLSGYGAEGCWAFIGKRKATLVVPMLAAEQANAIAQGYEIVSIKALSEVYALVTDYAVKAGWKTIGYDPTRTPESIILAMRKVSMKKLRWIPSPGAVSPLRVKKDAQEIKSLRRAGHLVAQGFAHIRRMAHPGLRECDLAAEFESFIRRHGAVKSSFDSIIAAGENAAYPHYITGNRILRKNDVVLCDLGALAEGYCSDLTRTFFLGTISPLGRKVYDTVARAQELAIQAVKPGVKAALIDRIARDEIERAGYGRRFIHSTGHGVGVEIHEAPWVGATSRDVLEPGMIITVEPGIYLQGWGGVRIEDTLLVTAKGSEILTK